MFFNSYSDSLMFTFMSIFWWMICHFLFIWRWIGGCDLWSCRSHNIKNNFATIISCWFPVLCRKIFSKRVNIVIYIVPVGPNVLAPFPSIGGKRLTGHLFFEFLQVCYLRFKFFWTSFKLGWQADNNFANWHNTFNCTRSCFRFKALYSFLHSIKYGCCFWKTFFNIITRFTNKRFHNTIDKISHVTFYF